MKKPETTPKSLDLDTVRVNHDGYITTNQGVGVSNTDDALKAGKRGPTLIEDFIFREKITHFDHERIPERIVHARGSGAHGYFQVYESMSHLTKAHFLSDPNLVTPVFVRFSTVAGFRGSPDTIKFPDLIHSVKPEPNNEMPQAASAHDTFWDFVVNTPETMHNVMWLMSPRAVPKSYRMMEGFGIHTFRLVNDKGEFKFDFDILDCTKLWPEELVPLQKIGKMTLDQNVTNFFAETEQVAFCPANVVPGIDFTNDPMLQGRLFSYIDTQISRLGGPNFQQIPINRPLSRVNNNQRDGMHRMTIDEGQTSYYPNSLNNGEPHAARDGESHFEHYQEKVEGHVIRERSESFRDHFTQPAMFWNSMSDWEKDHIIDAFRFQLGKCKNKNTHQKLVDMLGNVDSKLAQKVAEGLGATLPADALNPTTFASPALSMANTAQSPKTRKVAVLIEKDFDKVQFDAVTSALTVAGACVDVVSCKLGAVTANDNSTAECNQTYATTAPVFYEGIYIPGGSHIESLKDLPEVQEFLCNTFKHYKTIGLSGEAADLLCLLRTGQNEEPGVICQATGNAESYAGDFLAALTKGRHFQRKVC